MLRAVYTIAREWQPEGWLVAEWAPTDRPFGGLIALGRVRALIRDIAV